MHAIACDVTGAEARDSCRCRPAPLWPAARPGVQRLPRSGPILGLADGDLRLLFDVHVTAPFRLLQAVGGYWRAESKAGRGVEASVVLTTSAAGLYGFRAEAAYSAAKAAVAMLARVGADELGRYGATVNAVAPVAGLTEWLGEASASPGDDPLAADHVAPVIAWLLGTGGPQRHRARPGGRERPDLGAQRLAARPAVPAAIPPVPRGAENVAAPGARQRESTAAGAQRAGSSRPGPGLVTRVEVVGCGCG